MKKILTFVTILGLLTGQAEAATIAITQGSGTNLGMTQDGSGNSIYGGMLCGGTAATLYTVCVNQLEINSSGQALVLAAESSTTWAVQLNTTPSLANGNGVVPTAGGVILGTTNGLYSNILQGNAVLTTTNGIYTNLLQGNAVLSATNPLFVSPATSAVFAENISQVGGTGSFANYGATPSAVPAVPVNAFVTNTNTNISPADAIPTTTYGAASPVIGSSLLWNGTTYDRLQEAAGSTGVAAVNVPGPYPANAVPITASATGTTGATTATLTNATGHTTYICGLSVRSNATAAVTGNITVTGVKTATLNFTHWTAPLASGLGITEEVFAPCVPASAVSTSIVVVSPAPGTGGTVSVSAWGYSI